ncbi:MAG: hypothetical protein IJE46_02300 [Clostridia bacterium]|nr:hypothetical protein [Clostridia bacterium]
MRKFFPAANTPDGFCSEFGSVYNEKEDRKVIFIKGGSGTGKSTLMKKISDDAFKKGYEIEQFFCSSDPDSLDGVRIVDTKTAIVDATSPHVQDPFAPGITGKIYNIADFWNQELLYPHKQEVFELLSQKKQCFDDCYRYLKAAKELYPKHKRNLQDIKNVCEKFSFPYINKCGKSRKLFASGITPKGNVNFLDDILFGKIIGLEDSNASSDIIKHLNKVACIAGYDTEIYFCPMFPDQKAEHLVIKELSLCFTTLNEFHNFDKIDEKICFKASCQKPGMINELIEYAIKSLSKAKTYHNKVEQIYINAMDFEKMNKTYESLKSELL